MLSAKVADAVGVGSIQLSTDGVEAFGGPGDRILGGGFVQQDAPGVFTEIVSVDVDPIHKARVGAVEEGATVLDHNSFYQVVFNGSELRVAHVSTCAWRARMASLMIVE
jgi:hypothetical protein